MKRTFAMIAALTMVLSLASCGSDGKTSSTPESSTPASSSTPAASTPAGNDGEVPYLGEVEVYNAEAANVGLCTGWMPDYIRESAGVDMIGIAKEDGKFELMVTAGSLPDVTIIDGVDNLNYAIDAGLLIDLSTVMEKLPNLTKYEENDSMMQYVRDNCSSGTGGLYGLNRMYSESEIADMDVGGIFLRYDYFGDVGYPELKNTDDLLDALKAMQDAHPTTDDGKKIYGMSIFPDWDSATLGVSGYMARSMGYNFGLVDRDYHEYQGTNDAGKIIFRGITDNDSGYKKFLKFMFKANQMGLLDPDSMTQTFDDSKAKTASGRSLLSFDNWGTEYSAEDQANGIGFRRVPLTGDPYVADDCSPCPGGTHTFVTISKDCKNVDAACALINLMYDPEFTVTYMNGRRGEVWDQKEDGTPYMVEGGYEARANLDFNKRGCLVMLTYHFSAPLPGFNGYSTDYTLWPTQPWTPEDNQLVKNWKEHTVNGNFTAYGYMKSIDQYVVPPAVKAIVLDDETKMLEDRLKDVMKTANWKLVMAANEAEFESIWAETAETLNGIGLDKYVETWTETYRNALY